MMNFAVESWSGRLRHQCAVVAQRLVVVTSVLACLATTEPNENCGEITGSTELLSFELSEGDRVTQTFRIQSPGDAFAEVSVSVVGDNTAQVWATVDFQRSGASLEAGVSPDTGQDASGEGDAAQDTGDAGDAGENAGEDVGDSPGSAEPSAESTRIDPQMHSASWLALETPPGESTITLTLVHSGSGTVTVTVGGNIKMDVDCESSETITIDAL